MKMDLMESDELVEFLKYPRHEIMINEEVARSFLNASLAAIQKDSGDEILPPKTDAF